MSRPLRAGYKRHSIGIVINEDDARMMREELVRLKSKTNYTRNDILKIVCTKLLSDDDFINFCEIKGGLSK